MEDQGLSIALSGLVFSETSYEKPSKVQYTENDTDMISYFRTVDAFPSAYQLLVPSSALLCQHMQYRLPAFVSTNCIDIELAKHVQFHQQTTSNFRSAFSIRVQIGSKPLYAILAYLHHRTSASANGHQLD